MEKRELICIGCPLGCPLTVTVESNRVLVSGNTCKRGEEYARKEIQNPTRIVTGTVHVNNGSIAMVSVKSKSDIPKEKIAQYMEEISKITLEAPVSIGDVILADCANTGVPVVATKTVKRKQRGM